MSKKEAFITEKQVRYELKKSMDNIVRFFGLYVTKEQWEERCKWEVDRAIKEIYNKETL